ncbi:hypothetical protein HYU93_04005 [Candidatus Daviesbacteria bacterium]|nr:hypothetical protein [Candidatus Daviesbacteria bacterium]
MASRENGNPYGFYDALLDEAATAVARGRKATAPEDSGQVVIPVADINNGHARLVLGNFPYEKRFRGIPGRSLTGRSTIQPVFAVVEGRAITPIPYAENVLGLGVPLASEVVSRLEALRERQAAI